MNIPYKKEFDKDGNLLNSIVNKYQSRTLVQFIEIKDNKIPIFYPNRRERKEKLKNFKKDNL